MSLGYGLDTITTTTYTLYYIWVNGDGSDGTG